jgi:hypothetical protein
MSRLFLDLAEAECQLATLALVAGRAGLGARALDRATRYLTLRQQHSPADEAAGVLPMWARE